MRTSKRLVSLALALMLVVLTAFTSVMAASFTDVTEDHMHYEAINTLADIGIIMGYPDGTFGPERSITRAEFTALITRVLGLADVAGSVTTSVFPDVQPTHYAIGNIKLAYDLKIITGFPDGTFHPDETVTYEQAVKMIVAALGYTIRAEGKGGYPFGYVTTAAELGILENATVGSNSAPATRGIVAQLLYNALEVNIAEATGEDSTTITSKTMLADNLRLIKMEGRIDANQFSSLVAANSSLSAQQITINNVRLNLGEKFADFADKIGYHVRVYYKFDSSVGDNVVQSMLLSPNRNTVLTIDGSDVQVKNGAYFTYWRDSKHNQQPEEMTISSTASILYNSKLISFNELQNGNLIPTNGSITLIDSNNSDIYDVVIIKSYQNYIVRTIAGTTIYNEYDTSNPLVVPSTSTPANVVNIIRNGAAAKLTDIRSGDVLSVAASRDGRYMEIIATAKNVSGSITMATAKETITVAGVTYRLSDELIQYLDSKGITTLYQAGTSATFYLDDKNRVAWYRSSAATGTDAASPQYGYLITAGVSADGVDQTIQFKILTANLGVRTYTGASNIRVDGQSNMPYNAILQRLEANALTTNKDIYDPIDPLEITNTIRAEAQYSQLIKYTLNADTTPKINFIDTITKDPNESDDTLLSPGVTTYTKNGLPYRNGQLGSGTSAVGVYASATSTAPATKVFHVPLNRGDDQSYSVKTVASSFITDRSYLVEAFDLGSTRMSPAIVSYGGNDETKITVSSPLVIVKQVSSITDDQMGLPVQKLVGMLSTGAEVTYYTDADGVLNNLRPGQIIRFGTRNNRITASSPIAIEFDPYTMATNPPAIPTTGSDYNTALRYKEYGQDGNLLSGQGYNTNAYYRTLFATVVASDESSVRLSAKLPTENVLADDMLCTYLYDSSTKFIVFDSTRPTVDQMIRVETADVGKAMLMSYEDATTDASQVFVYSSQSGLKMVYIVQK